MPPASKQAKVISEAIAPLRVEPGTKVDLAKDFDPGYKAGFVKKSDGDELLAEGVRLVSEYQERLAARTPTACSSSCRRSTPRARTGRSAT